MAINNKIQLLLMTAFFTSFIGIHYRVNAGWRYEGVEGPGNWPEIVARCAGASQSPINILEHKVVVNNTFSNLQLSNYDKTPPNGWTITNNGHTVTITGTLAGTPQPFLHDGGLPSEYEFYNLHIHWGKGENPGSEHLLDYKRFPAELHIVHKRGDFAASGSDDWQKESTGLAVLAVIIDIGDADNPYFEPVIKALGTIQYESQSASIANVQLRDFLPRRAKNADEDLAFFRYLGSLTTPDCFESVIWTVLQRHVYISAQQYLQLQKLHESALPSQAEGDAVIVNNYRPVQPLNGRIVEANREYKDASNVAEYLSPTSIMHGFCLMYAVVFVTRTISSEIVAK